MPVPFPSIKSSLRAVWLVRLDALPIAPAKEAIQKLIYLEAIVTWGLSNANVVEHPGLDRKILEDSRTAIAKVVGGLFGGHETRH